MSITSQTIWNGVIVSTPQKLNCSLSAWSYSCQNFAHNEICFETILLETIFISYPIWITHKYSMRNQDILKRNFVVVKRPWTFLFNTNSDTNELQASIGQSSSSVFHFTITYVGGKVANSRIFFPDKLQISYWQRSFFFFTDVCSMCQKKKNLGLVALCGCSNNFTACYPFHRDSLLTTYPDTQSCTQDHASTGPDPQLSLSWHRAPPTVSSSPRPQLCPGRIATLPVPLMWAAARGRG